MGKKAASLSAGVATPSEATLAARRRQREAQSSKTRKGDAVVLRGLNQHWPTMTKAQALQVTHIVAM